MESLTFSFALISLFVTIFLTPFITAALTKQDWDLEVAVTESTSLARDVDATDLTCQYWLLMYCNRPYDPVAATCGGKCSPWDENSYTLRNAAGTECIAIRPSNVNFTACSDIVTGRLRGPARCTWVGNWKSEHIYTGMDGFTFFDAPGTNSLFITQCGQDSAGTTDGTDIAGRGDSANSTEIVPAETGDTDGVPGPPPKPCTIPNGWKMMFCNRGYDASNGICGGKCTYWDNQQKLVIDAPGTQCIATIPAFQPLFRACNSGGKCTQSAGWPLNGKHDIGGISIYEATGTQTIIITPCG